MRKGQLIAGQEPTPPSEAEFLEGFNMAGTAVVAEMRKQAASKRDQAERLLQEAKALDVNAKQLEAFQKEKAKARRGSRGLTAGEIVVRLLAERYRDVTKLPPPERGRTSPARQYAKRAVESGFKTVFVPGSSVFSNTWQRLLNKSLIGYATRTDEG